MSLKKYMFQLKKFKEWDLAPDGVTWMNINTAEKTTTHPAVKYYEINRKKMH